MDTWEPNFNPDQNFSMAIVASRRSGKTTLLKSLMKNHIEKSFDQIVLISNTLSNEIYDDFAPEHKLTRLSVFNNDVIQGLITMQQEEGEDSEKVLVVIDDCVGNSVKYSSGLLKLFCVSRNLNMSIIYSVQDSTCLLPSHRENLDFLIIMRIKTFPKIKHIIDTFLIGNLESDEIKTNKEEFEVWHKLIKTICVDHRAIVVDYIDDKMLKFKIEI